MPKLFSSLTLSAILSGFGWALPVGAQTLVPYTPNADLAQFEVQGLALAEEASQLAQLQQFELALARARVAAQLAPDRVQVWRLLGALYLQDDDLEAALKALQTARSLEPDNPDVLFVLGSAYFQQQRYDESVEVLELALDRDSDRPTGRFDLGNAYLMRRDFSEAIAEYRKAADLDEQLWPAVNNIGLAQYEMGDVEAAIRSWEASLEIDPEAAEPKLAIAVARYAQSQCDRGDANSAPCRAGLAAGEAALTLDDRYGELDFLEENLWGQKLLEDAERFLNHPQIQSFLGL